jgi:hypothetical protein
MASNLNFNAFISKKQEILDEKASQDIISSGKYLSESNKNLKLIQQNNKKLIPPCFANMVFDESDLSSSDDEF